MKCEFCGYDINHDDSECRMCFHSKDVPLSDIVEKSKCHNRLLSTKGMKWYKFIIYFQLIFSALFNLSTGIQYLTGTADNGNLALVWQMRPNFAISCWIYGIVMIGVGAFGFYVRSMLKNFYRGAPSMLSAYYVLSYGSSLLFNLYLKYFTSFYVQKSIFISFICALVFISLNSNYFTERYRLFVFDRHHPKLRPGQDPQAPQVPLKWYKFIVNVFIIYLSLSYISNAIVNIMSLLGGENTQGTKILLMVFSVIFIALAVAGLIIRSRLVNFYRNSDKLLFAYLVGGFAIMIAYVFLIGGTPRLFYIAYNVPIIIYTYINFKKRENLFVLTKRK